MVNKRRIARNSSAVTLGMLLGGGIIFLTMVMLARYLGVEEYGLFSTLLAIVSVIQLFVDGGMVNITIRDIAKDKQKLAEHTGAASVGLLLVSALITPVVIFALWITNTSWHFSISLIWMLLGGFAALQGLIFGAAIRAMEDMQITAAIGVIHKVLLALLVAGVIWFEGDVVAVACVHFIANLIQTLWLQAVVVKKYGSIRYRADIKRWRELSKDSLPLGVAMILRKMTIHLDLLLLSVLATVFAVGLYSSAYRVLQMIETASIAFSGVMLPVLSQLAANNRQKLENFFNHIFTLMIVASAPVAVWFYLAAENLIEIFFGQQYVGAHHVLQILGVALVFLIPAALLHPIYAAIHKPKLLMQLAFVGLIMNIVVDLVLIQYFSYIGAAIGTAFTECIILLLGLNILSKHGVKLTNLGKILAIVLCAVIVGGVYSLLPSTPGILPELLRLLVSAFAYVILLFVFKIYSTQDIKSALRNPSDKNATPVDVTSSS